MVYTTTQELLERNKQFVRSGHIPMPYISEMGGDHSHTIVISCFDPRSSPEEYLKLNSSKVRECVSLRNAGGRPQHAIHDLVALDSILETKNILIVHHTDCGLTHMTKESIGSHLAKYVTPEQKSTHDYDKYDFGLIGQDQLAESTRADVKWLREHPWIRPETEITGYVYDIKTGLLQAV